MDPAEHERDSNLDKNSSSPLVEPEEDEPNMPLVNPEIDQPLSPLTEPHRYEDIEKKEEDQDDKV